VSNVSAKTGGGTRARVLDAVRGPAYKPNIIAGSLTERKIYTTGAVLQDILSPFFAEVVKEIESSFKNENHRMLPTTSEYGEVNTLELTR
jgi:DNA-binding LacI/PurR family transcriptional regulator